MLPLVSSGHWYTHTERRYPIGAFRFEDGVLYIGERKYPWVVCREFTEHDLGDPFDKHYRRIFALMFETGYTLSIVWGTYTYSDNYNGRIDGQKDFVEEPDLVEIAVLKDGELLHLWGDEDDDWKDSVKGYCSADFVNGIIDSMKAGWPSVLEASPND